MLRMLIGFISGVIITGTIVGMIKYVDKSSQQNEIENLQKDILAAKKQNDEMREMLVSNFAKQKVEFVALPGHHQE